MGWRVCVWVRLRGLSRCWCRGRGWVRVSGGRCWICVMRRVWRVNIGRGRSVGWGGRGTEGGRSRVGCVSGRSVVRRIRRGGGSRRRVIGWIVGMRSVLGVRGRRGISRTMFWRGRKDGGCTGRSCGGRIDGGGHEGGRSGKGRLAGWDLSVHLGRGLGMSRGGWVGAMRVLLLPSGGVVVVLLLALGGCLALKREGLTVNVGGGRSRRSRCGCRVAERGERRAVGGGCRGGGCRMG